MLSCYTVWSCARMAGTHMGRAPGICRYKWRYRQPVITLSALATVPKAKCRSKFTMRQTYRHQVAGNMQPCNAITAGATIRLVCGSSHPGSLQLSAARARSGPSMRSMLSQAPRNSEAWTIMRSTVDARPRPVQVAQASQDSCHQHCMYCLMAAACKKCRQLPSRQYQGHTPAPRVPPSMSR